jgi:hypothetical protein
MQTTRRRTLRTVAVAVALAVAIALSSGCLAVLKAVGAGDVGTVRSLGCGGSDAKPAARDAATREIVDCW